MAATRYTYGVIPDHPDVNDFRYSAPRYLVGLPSLTDMRSKLPPSWDQGRIGSCGPHGLSAAIVHSQRHQMLDDDMPSRLFLYYATREAQDTVGQDSGVSIRTMLKVAAKTGYCEEQLWPYRIEKFRERPYAVCYADGQRRKITDYARVASDPEQIRGALASGHLLVIGFSVYSSYETDETARTGLVPLPRRGERQLGGHCVAIVGYDDSQRVYHFRQSYGTGWGINGYGHFPYDFIHNPALTPDIWVINTVTGTDDDPDPVSPPPTPPPVKPTKRKMLIEGDFVLRDFE